MRDFVITVNSTVDLPREWLEERHVPVFPLKYTIDGETYTDMYGLTGKEFFEKLREGHEREIRRFIEELPTDLPYYLSVDKDVLRPGDASTSWSQGDMKLEELLEYLELIFRNQVVLGMDVCGECDPDSVMDGRCNDAANKKLLKLSERY